MRHGLAGASRADPAPMRPGEAWKRAGPAPYPRIGKL